MVASLTLLRTVFALLLFVMLLAPATSLATTCDEDCHGRCRQCIKYDLGLIKDEKCIIEPTCHTRCEMEKKAACALRTPIPSIPSLPNNPLEIPGQLEQSCKAPFESFTHSTIAYCANWGGRADDLQEIEKAKKVLIELGFANSEEFNGIDIRWCPLKGGGMVPEHNRILLHPDLKKNEAALISTLGHEMHHIRQYRQWGGDRFKCNYSRELVAGKGQGRANSVEREAYEYEDRVSAELERGRTLRICNNSDKSSNVAVGYKAATEWYAKGWYIVEPNSCKNTASELKGVVYVHATTNPLGAGTVWVPDDEPVKFCIDVRDSFELPDSKCQHATHADYQWATFGVIFRGGYGTHVMTLGK